MTILVITHPVRRIEESRIVLNGSPDIDDAQDRVLMITSEALFQYDRLRASLVGETIHRIFISRAAMTKAREDGLDSFLDLLVYDLVEDVARDVKIFMTKP